MGSSPVRSLSASARLRRAASSSAAWTDTPSQTRPITRTAVHRESECTHFVRIAVSPVRTSWAILLPFPSYYPGVPTHATRDCVVTDGGNGPGVEWDRSAVVPTTPNSVGFFDFAAGAK